MNHNLQLIDILKGCLNPSSVQMAQNQLVDYSRSSNFIPELLQLIPNQPNDIVIMVLSTIKNFCQQNYTHPENPIPEGQKQVLRDNIFNLFYIINNIPQAVNLYKQIVYIIVSTDFERYQDTFYRLLKLDIDGSILASVYFSRQVTRFYEYLTHEQKEPLERFVNDLFPRIEQLVEKIISEYNQTTRVLLLELLEMFYSSFHVDLPVYFRNFDNLNKWILYITTIFQAPINDFPDNHIIVSKIYVKLFSMYCKDGTDGKNYRGWSALFRQKYALDLYNQVIKMLINPVSQMDVMANIPICLCSVVNNPHLKGLIQEDHCQAIIYKHLLPYMETTQQDFDYYKNDSLEYIRRVQDLTCHPFRRTSLDLIRCICEKLSFGNKSELFRFVEYSGEVFNGNYSDKQKEVVLTVLIELEALIMKKTSLKDNFQNMVIQFFIPLVKTSNNMLVSQTLKLLSTFLQKANLSTKTVTQLMSLLYEKMCVDDLVVKYFAVLAFTKLLDDKQALQSARPHFQQILKIYVKLLEVIDHEGLICSLQSVVKVFSTDIVEVAQNLVNHLLNLFYSFHSKSAEQHNDDDLDIESKEASAALSTIKQILQSPLSSHTYLTISQKLMILLQHLCSDYDDYFEQILSMFNTLVYKSRDITNFEFPYLLCLKLLEGNNYILSNCENKDFVQIISAAEKADTQYSQNLISILKNLVQKMPQHLLHKYPYSTNPQIILCMIENKKLNASQLNSLNTSEVDIQWRLILQSYTAAVYGLGQVCPINDLKMLTDVVKKMMNALEEEQVEDQYFQQNTVQMLQKFANEDDDDADYYISSGGNYSYLYDSPFDSTKDPSILVAKLKSLTENQFNYVLSNLKQKSAMKLQILVRQ